MDDETIARVYVFQAANVTSEFVRVDSRLRMFGVDERPVPLNKNATFAAFLTTGSRSSLSGIAT